MRCLPSGRTDTTPASRRRRRCREIAGWLIGNSPTSSETLRSSEASASTICTRVSSARAANAGTPTTYNRSVMQASDGSAVASGALGPRPDGPVGLEAIDGQAGLGALGDRDPLGDRPPHALHPAAPLGDHVLVVAGVGAGRADHESDGDV